MPSVYVSSLAYTLQNATVNAAMAAPTAATDGAAVPIEGCGEYAHLVLSKTNAVNGTVYGYLASTAAWYALDTLQLTATENEAQLMPGITSFARVCLRATSLAQHALGMNIGWGFTTSGRGG